MKWVEVCKSPSKLGAALKEEHSQCLWEVRGCFRLHPAACTQPFAPGPALLAELPDHTTTRTWLQPHTQALERVIPDIRSRTEVCLVGTPLTHERYLRRHRGSYGPAISAAGGSWPGAGTPLPGLSVCGDSCMPGIGVPAAVSF